MFKRLSLALLLVVSLALPARAANTFVVASDATWPPYEMLDDDKNIIGYGPDYIRAVAGEIGMEADIRNVAWDGIFAALENRQCDVISSSLTITPERSKTMLFTVPYLEIFQAVVVPTGSPVQKLTDLGGRTVGGQIGTTGVLYIDRLNEEQKLGAVVKTYDEIGLAMEDLKNGRIDSVICDDRVAKYYAERQAGYAGNMRVAFFTEEVEYYGFALRKSDTAFLEQLNKGIEAVKASGLAAKLQAQWLD
jgi:polar amino acid transport system substrate-binding protein